MLCYFRPCLNGFFEFWTLLHLKCMNLTLYHLFYCFARKYTILKGSDVTSPAVFNRRRFTISYIHSVNAVFSKVVQVLEADIHGSIEVHMFQFDCCLFKNSQGGFTSSDIWTPCWTCVSQNQNTWFLCKTPIRTKCGVMFTLIAFWPKIWKRSEQKIPF